MITVTARFDGTNLVPNKPINVPRNKDLKVHIDIADNGAPSALEWLAQNAADDASLPSDLALNHSHYLYGTPKKER